MRIKWGNSFERTSIGPRSSEEPALPLTHTDHSKTFGMVSRNIETVDIILLGILFWCCYLLNKTLLTCCQGGSVQHLCSVPFGLESHTEGNSRNSVAKSKPPETTLDFFFLIKKNFIGNTLNLCLSPFFFSFWDILTWGNQIAFWRENGYIKDIIKRVLIHKAVTVN